MLNALRHFNLLPTSAIKIIYEILKKIYNERTKKAPKIRKTAEKTFFYTPEKANNNNTNPENKPEKK